MPNRMASYPKPMDWLLVVHAVQGLMTLPDMPNIFVMFTAVVWAMDFKKSAALMAGSPSLSPLK
jgi:hypothetical protein